MATGSQRRALAMAGISRSTWYYRRHGRPRVAEPLAHAERAYRSRVDTADRAVIIDRIQQAWARGCSVDWAFAAAWDDGLMLASRRTWWRIAATIADHSGRPVVPTRRHARTARIAPVVEATGPQQAWSWDITDLRGHFKGTAFKAYSVIDLYSRKIVGWRVEEREADDLARDMFAVAFDTHGAPDTVHADSGAPMRSDKVGDLFAGHGVSRSHNRPRVSNDNPFSEAEFRTMKYRPGYPGTFTDLEQARDWVGRYVTWYNRHHRHSGIALFTPDTVHDGSWHEHWRRRERALVGYHARHPERFRQPPTTPTPRPRVGINLPATQNTTR